MEQYRAIQRVERCDTKRYNEWDRAILNHTDTVWIQRAAIVKWRPDSVRALAFKVLLNEWGEWQRADGGTSEEIAKR